LFFLTVHKTPNSNQGEKYPPANLVFSPPPVPLHSQPRSSVSYEGVKENEDGTFELDIKAQTKAVIEKYVLNCFFCAFTCAVKRLSTHLFVFSFFFGPNSLLFLLISFRHSINVILQSQGASLANIVDMTIFLTNMKDYGAMNQVPPYPHTNRNTSPARTNNFTTKATEMPLTTLYLFFSYFFATNLFSKI